MTRYPCVPGLWVCALTKRQAEAHTRLVHNVREGVRLGWTPYRFIVTSYGGVCYCAFETMRDFKRWLASYHVSLPTNCNGVRFGKTY